MSAHGHGCQHLHLQYARFAQNVRTMKCEGCHTVWIDGIDKGEGGNVAYITRVLRFEDQRA